jgi:tripartite motif-containing protein 23
MCIICKDYGTHRGHRHNLVTLEAEKARTLLLGALQRVQTFSQDVQTASEHIARVIDEIQCLGISNTDASERQGTAEDARQRVRNHFAQMREVLLRQEEAGLELVSKYVDERLQSFHEHRNMLAALVAQITRAATECGQTLSSDDIRIIEMKPNVLSLLDSVLQQQEQLTGLIADVRLADPAIPVAFGRDNTVHIGSNVEMRVLVLGLDNAGKTAILFKLKQDEFMPTIPTIGFNVETVEHSHAKLTFWDVGGMEKIRPLWRHYYHNTQAVVFVVDSEDSSRFPEVGEELTKLVGEAQLKETLLLILANKQDVPRAIGTEVLTECLALQKLCCGRTWNIYGSSARTGQGLDEALQWLSMHSVGLLLEAAQ